MKTVLITGASSGIGYELAKIFADNQYDLVIIGRDEMRLNDVAESLRKEHGIHVLAITKDLSLPNSAKEIYDVVINANMNIDILINNAGSGKCGPFYEIEDNVNMDMIQLEYMQPNTANKLLS